MKKTLILFALCHFALYSIAQWDIDSVPDPIKVGSFISDPNAYLQGQTIDSLNFAIANMTDKTGAEFAIVVLDSISISNHTVFNFALLLFENRGIGKATNDNGLLLLIVVTLREYRFMTGYGLEHILTDAKLRSIGEEYLLPYFKNENYDEGLLQTVNQITHTVIDYHENPQNQEDNSSISPFADFDMFDFVLLKMKYFAIFGLVWIIIGLPVYFFLLRKNKKTGNVLFSSITRTDSDVIIHSLKPSVKFNILSGRETLHWILIYLLPGILLPLHLVPALAFPELPPIFLMLIVIYIYVAIYQSITMTIKMKFIEEASYFKEELAYNFEIYGPKLQQLIFMPIPFILFFIQREKMLKESNISEALCPTCQTITSLQSSDTISKHLGKGYAKEQELDVFKYRIYTCPKGHTHTLRLHGLKVYSYTRCSACNHNTLSVTERKTLKEATYSESGEMQVSYECLNCGMTKTEISIISKLSSSYSSNSYSSGKSYSSSSKSYSSSGSSSRSSSSSRSWGGGRTGGGGAGGRW